MKQGDELVVLFAQTTDKDKAKKDKDAQTAQRYEKVHNMIIWIMSQYVEINEPAHINQHHYSTYNIIHTLMTC